MLQTSTTDIEINLLPNGEISRIPVSALNPDDNAFYNSLKEQLNKISKEPSEETIEKILKYSRKTPKV